MPNAILLGKGFNPEISGRYSLTVAPTPFDQHRKEDDGTFMIHGKSFQLTSEFCNQNASGSLDLLSK
jgi:hypothetical protein